MVKSPSLKKTFTPTLRKLNLLLATLKPNIVTRSIGRAQRETRAGPSSSAHGQENHAPAPSSQAKTTQPAACSVALQNEDASEDAIVITSLPTIPFCCHADLVTMPRASLVSVANALNARLPVALRIDTGPARDERFIRNSIEVLVGLNRTGTVTSGTVPQAPKPVKSRLLPAHRAEDALPSPGSPLATRSHKSSSTLPSGAGGVNAKSGGAAANSEDILSVLKEEDDEGPAPTPVARPAATSMARKRKLEIESTASSPSPLAAPDFGRAVAPAPAPAPGRMTRAQSHRVNPTYRAPAHARVLRARSQRLPGKPLDLYNHPNITVARGRTASGSSLRRAASARAATGREVSPNVLTSTPKRRKTFHHREATPSPSPSPRKNARRSTGTGHRSPKQKIVVASPSSKVKRRKQRQRMAGRRASAPVPVDSYSHVSQGDTTAEVTFGMDEMSMAISNSASDMDFGSD